MVSISLMNKTNVCPHNALIALFSLGEDFHVCQKHLVLKAAYLLSQKPRVAAIGAARHR